MLVEVLQGRTVLVLRERTVQGIPVVVQRLTEQQVLTREKTVTVQHVNVVAVTALSTSLLTSLMDLTVQLTGVQLTGVQQIMLMMQEVGAVVKAERERVAVDLHLVVVVRLKRGMDVMIRVNLSRV